jgi:WS/DGAT/MGAT family acyltransferase
MAPFDRRRPLWQGVLVDGLADGRAAYILKLHHSLADGIGSVQLVDMLHSDRREPTPDKPDRPPLELRRRASADLLREQLTGVVRGAPGALLRAGTSGLGGARHAVAQPTRTAVDALRFAASLDRVAKTQPAPPSPLLAPRSLRWHFEALDVSLRDLRAAGKAAGASLNDAYVAALLGAFRRYHEEFGLPIAELPVAVPVSLRRSADEPGANRFTGVRFAAPVGEPDPRLRIRRVRELIDRERTEPALPALAGAASLFGVLPGQISGAFAARLAQANDLQASNIPGLARPAYMAGARITHIYPFGPLPGCAAMITLISHEGTCCIGANLDAAAWTDTALFASCLGQGFEEVLSLSTSALRRSSSSVGASPAATR